MLSVDHPSVFIQRWKARVPQPTDIASAADRDARYVAFLDLLGFTDLVTRAEHDASKRIEVRDILKLVQDSLCEVPAIDMRLTYFSDCLVVSTIRTALGLLEMLNSIECLTMNLLQYDVLLRGGLAVGWAHHDESMVFGTGLIRAYELENREARHPLTLLAPDVVADAQASGQTHMAWLQTDGANRYFVNYLRYYADYRPEPIFAGKVILDDAGLRIVDFLCQRLNNHQGSVRDKARWLQDYWNRTVAVHGVFPTIETGVTKRHHSHGPTIIVRRILR